MWPEDWRRKFVILAGDPNFSDLLFKGATDIGGQLGDGKDTAKSLPAGKVRHAEIPLRGLFWHGSWRKS